MYMPSKNCWVFWFLLVVLTLFKADLQAEFIQSQSLPLLFTGPGNSDVYGIALGDLNGDGVLDVVVSGEATAENLPTDGQRAFVAALIGNGDGTFQAPMYVDFGGETLNARGVRIADLDNDEIPDLAVGIENLDGVIVLRGKGDGSFFIRTLIPTQLEPTSVEVADVDLDGNIDVVAAGSFDGEIAIAWGNGDFTFSDAQILEVGDGSFNPRDLIIENIDGEGGLDLIIACYRVGQLCVLKNENDRSFSEIQSIELGTTPTGLRLGRFDDDAHLDLAISADKGITRCGVGCLGIATGNGDGTFNIPSLESYASTQELFRDGFDTSSMRASDFNKDGFDDVVFASGTKNNLVTVGLSNGDGTFSVSTYVAGSGTPQIDASSVPPEAIETKVTAVGDLNHDGVLDIIVGAEGVGGATKAEGGAWILFGNEAELGTFHSPRMIHTFLNSQASWIDASVLDDFNEDGHLDLAMIANTIDIAFGDGEGWFSDPETKLDLTSGEFLRGLRKHDLNGDHHTDLIFLGTSGVQGGASPRIIVTFGDGEGNLINEAGFNFGSGIRGQTLGFADFDGDEVDDIAFLGWSPQGAMIDVWKNSYPSGGDLERMITLPVGERVDSESIPLGVGYLEGDDHADIVAFEGSENLKIWRGNGDGTFSDPQTISGLPPVFAIKLVDLNEDGFNDILCSIYTTLEGGLITLLSDGQGGFGEPIHKITGPNAALMQCVDINKDGHLDVALTHGTSSSRGQGFAVLHGDGQGGFSDPRYAPIGFRAALSVNLGDLNHDGQLDAVVGHEKGSLDLKSPYSIILGDPRPASDLTLEMTATPSEEIIPSDIIEYTLKVTNHGPQPTTGIKVINPLKQGFSFLGSPSTEDVPASFRGSEIQLTFPDLEVGESAEAQIELIVMQAGTVLWNTASVSSDIHDPQPGNNAAAVMREVRGAVQVEGPPAIRRLFERVTTGLRVRWLNPEPTVLEDAVLLVTLPSVLFFRDASEGGTYLEGSHEIVFHLGDLDPFQQGISHFTVELPAGIPPGEVTHTAMLAGSNQEDPAFEVSEYDSLELPEVVEKIEIPEEAILDTLSEAMLEVYEHLQDQGFVDAASLESIVLNDGREQNILYCINITEQKFARIIEEEDVVIFESISTSEWKIGDATGALEIDLGSDTQRMVGSWALANSPSLAQCVRNCLIDKLGSALIGKIRVLGPIWNSWLCVKCFKRGGKAEDCKECLQKIKKTTGLDEAADILRCASDCHLCKKGILRNDRGEDTCHTCNKDKKVCLDRKGVWHYLGVHSFQTIRCRDGVLDWSGDVHRCESHQKCVKGKCKDVCDYSESLIRRLIRRSEIANGGGGGLDEDPIQGCNIYVGSLDSSVLVGRDPNEKFGLSGDLLPSTTLEYRIEYENVGDAPALDVFIYDEIDPSIDPSTIEVQNDGYYDPSLNLIVWFPGVVEASEGGEVSFMARLRDGIEPGTTISNQAIIVFPSVPEVTPTSVLINQVRELIADPQILDAVDGTPLNITLSGSSTRDLENLEFEIVDGPDQGELTGVPPEMSYLSRPGYTGGDQFSFLVRDDSGSSRPGVIEINVQSGTQDEDPPVVVQVSPREGAQLVKPLDLQDETVFRPIISAYFDEPMDPGSLDAQSLQVFQGESQVPGQVVWNDVSLSIGFLPSVPAVAGATYRAQLSDSVTDLAGNPLGDGVSWQWSIFPDDSSIQFVPSALNFERTPVQQTEKKELRVVHVDAESSNLHLVSWEITNDPDHVFSLNSTDCEDVHLVPLGECPVEVSFSPPTIGNWEAELILSIVDGQGEAQTQSLSLSGSSRAESGGAYLRSDANCDRIIDITDPIFTLSFMFLGTDEPCCTEAADTDGNSLIEITDPIVTLTYLFIGGLVPAPPFPDCGGEGCEDYPDPCEAQAE